MLGKIWHFSLTIERFTRKKPRKNYLIMNYYEIDVLRRTSIAIEAENLEKAKEIATECCDDDWFGTWYEGETEVECAADISERYYKNYGDRKLSQNDI